MQAWGSSLTPNGAEDKGYQRARSIFRDRGPQKLHRQMMLRLDLAHRQFEAYYPDATNVDPRIVLTREILGTPRLRSLCSNKLISSAEMPEGNKDSARYVLHKQKCPVSALEVSRTKGGTFRAGEIGSSSVESEPPTVA